MQEDVTSAIQVKSGRLTRKKLSQPKLGDEKLEQQYLPGLGVQESLVGEIQL